MTNNTLWGMVLGLALAVVSLHWGIWGFFLGAIFMLVGALLGRWTSGKLDVRGVFKALTGNNATSD